MKTTIGWIALILAICGGLWYWSVQREMKSLEQVEVVSPGPATAQPRQPAPIQHPVADIQVSENETETASEPEPPALPPLESSDPEMIAQIQSLVGNDWVRDWVVSEYLVSRAVAAIDSLPSDRVAPLMSPLKPVPGQFKVLGSGDEVAMSPENAARYEPLVDALVGLDQEQLLNTYVLYYPLFQEAFEAQGYPEAYFNDRLVAVIDLLLATPEPRGVLKLKQNEAVYEFADEDLERLSAGQKMMLRLGYDNQIRVKQWLRGLRELIAGEASSSLPVSGSNSS